MMAKYVIHRMGTPKMAFPNHSSYFDSEYWNDEDGWGHKSTATVYEDENKLLPLEGEWVEIYVNEAVK